jgi:molybdate transport system substrate-binding protein
MYRSRGFLSALIVMLLTACSGAAPVAPTAAPASPAAPTADAALSGPLNVFAAASLTDAFEEIAVAFEAAYPGAAITYNFAGSQQLAAQINEGAPADIFASANRNQMEAAIAGGRITAGSEQTFVRNRLVVITPADNPAGIATLQDLARPGLRLIFADSAVPVGQYTIDFLAKASALPEYTESYSATVLANVVSFEENVRSVLTKISLGEGDAGVVYTTDAALDAASIRQVAIPDELNTIASYPIAPVADSSNPALAQAFIDFVLAPEGQQILVKYGFISPTGAASQQPADGGVLHAGYMRPREW